MPDFTEMKNELSSNDKDSIPFWNNETAKTKSLLLLFTLAGAATFPLFALSLFNPLIILWFPTGLLNFTGKYLGDNSAFAIPLGWIFYLGISTTIVKTKKENVARSLFLILIILLILNVGGCYSSLSQIH